MRPIIQLQIVKKFLQLHVGEILFNILPIATIIGVVVWFSNLL
jgi:hypothetical protein